MDAPAPSVLFPSARIYLELGSAIFGIFGTLLMTRRYTSGTPMALLIALMAPVLYLAGQGERVREFYTARTRANREVPVAASRMALGLNLLCWAFFLQLLLAFIS
jgi:hypothetical protein